MARYIDADALIEAMKKTEEEFEKAMTCPSWWTAFDIIKIQPTAYDVEAKVTELERYAEGGFGCSDCPYEYLEKCGSCCEAGAFLKAIEIVRGKE